MSCTETHPVNLMYSKQTCAEDCSFQFEYSKNSSCMVTNEGDYLEIKVDGPNTVLFNGYNVGVTSCRLYQPSLHLFDGLKTSAEIIIEHQGAGNTVLVCVPVTAKDVTSSSSRFFNQFMPVIPTEEGVRQNINVNNWSLNAIVPDAPFYFYVGALPYPPCSGTNNIIVFSKEHGALMGLDDYDILRNSIQAIQLSDAQRLKAVAADTTLIMMNNKGSQPPGGANAGHVIFEDCHPIDGMGGKTKKDSPAQKGGKAPSFIYLMLVVLAVITLAGAIKWLCTGGASGGAAAAPQLGGGRRGKL